MTRQPFGEAVTERRGLVLAGILFAVILAGIDTIVLSVVMPTIVADLGGKHLVAWAFSAYMLTSAASMPVWGPGSDRWGRRRTFMASILVFLVGSVLCAIAPTMPLFLAARALQGVGAGGLFSLPYVILAVVYPPEKRGRALGVVTTAWALSAVTGPALGTALVSTFTWPAVFYVNLPAGFIAAGLVLYGMEESRPEAHGRFDALGSVLAAAGASLLIWAFVNMSEGVFGVLEAVNIALGLAAFAAFVRVEQRAEEPVLPLEFFRHRGFSSSIGAGTLAHFTAFGIVAYLPFKMDLLYGQSSLEGALVITGLSVGWSFTGFASGRIVHRVGERRLILGGMTLVAVALLLFPLVVEAALPALVPVAFMFGTGMGAMTPAFTTSVQNAVDVARMGSATSSLQFMRQLGAAVGVGAFNLAYYAYGFAVGVSVLLLVIAGGIAFAARMPITSLESATPPSEPAT